MLIMVCTHNSKIMNFKDVHYDYERYWTVIRKHTVYRIKLYMVPDYLCSKGYMYELGDSLIFIQ